MACLLLVPVLAVWHAGAVYDSGLRVTEFAANTCGSACCGAGNDNHDDEKDERVAKLADADVDVDFRRIPCAYKSKNLAVKVEETSSRDRGYLALRFLYQGGQTDIAAVEVAQAVTGSSGTNNEAAPPQTYVAVHGPGARRPRRVWRTSRVPTGPLQLRLVVTAGSGGKWLRADGAVLPAEWQPGAVYDTGLRVTDVAANTCGAASCSAMDEVDDAEQLR
uniref:Uncharacterized protein n=1 Tax=Aegilops tauschii TaxID=37682 RepID=M8CB90_AEGTA